MTKITKYLFFILGIFCILFFIICIGGLVIESYRTQKIMNGVYNLKLLGQAMLAYQEQNNSFPWDQKGNILFQKMQLQTTSFKRYATPNVYNCKGIIEKNDKKDFIALGFSEDFYDFFTSSRYLVEMKIKLDGSVVTFKKRLH